MIEQFLHLVTTEFELYGITFSVNLKKNEIAQMLTDYKMLLNQWEQLNKASLKIKLKLDHKIAPAI